MKIIVPATSANVGPGFDSVGIAVSKYLTIDVLEPADAWLIEHDLGAGIPTDEKNLLLSTALSIAPAIQPHHIKMTSEVPLARGLGSSSSVIVAGIELANQLANLQLSLGIWSLRATSVKMSNMSRLTSQAVTLWPLYRATN